MALSLSAANAQSQQPAMPGGMGGMQMAAQSEKARPAAPAGPLEISFDGKSAEWTPATLATLPHVTVTVRNSHTKTDETYSGVPLFDLLVKLGLPAKPSGKDLLLYLVAVGSDGYKVAYSVAEVNPAQHDATVIVADAQDGKPITAKGPLRLIATRDLALSRCVSNLVAIKLLAAQ
jgi:hypothetical protein